jgi:hypothetical protein
MDVGHQPTDWKLHQQQRNNCPMEMLRGCSVLKLLSHAATYQRVIISTQHRLPLRREKGFDPQEIDPITHLELF